MFLPIHGKDETNDKVFNRKALLSEIKADLKAQKYSQADDKIKKAVAEYSEAKQDAEIINIHMNVAHHLSEAENRKIFLNSKPDTAAYLNQIYRVYELGLLCDSLDSLPNRKGKIRPRYTENIKERLTFYRKNLISAGKYFYKKQKYHDALRFIQMYINTRDFHLIQDTLTSYQDIYPLAVFSSYGAENYDAVKTYLPRCESDSLHRSLLCQIGSKTYMATNDTLTALRYLNAGWECDPTKDYFYLTLVHYYIDHIQYGKALSIINKQLLREPESQELWYIKGKSLQCLDSLDEAIGAYQQVVSLNPKHMQALSSMGETYVTQAHNLYKSTTAKVGSKDYIQSRKRQNALYNKACEVLEQVRNSAPDDQTLWFTNLREVYYRLNKGKELKELEKIKK